jgi:hypothetical protein
MKNLIFVLLLIPFRMIFAQEIAAKVTVNFESLQTEYREKLVNFASQVEDYINKNKWTDLKWEGPKIPVSIQVYFKSGNPSNRYSAQVVISSQRPIYQSEKSTLMLKLIDPNWEFTYEKNQVLLFNPSLFESLTGFINYYVYVILGIDSDSYEEFGGTKFFNQALSIAYQGASSNFSNGWAPGEGSFNRVDFVSEYLNEKFQNFRKAFFDYHYNGLDLASEDPTLPAKKLINFIKVLEDLRNKVFSRSILLKVFFDTKYLEFCEVLRNYSDKSVFDRLKKIDPAHISTYDEYQKKRE